MSRPPFVVFTDLDGTLLDHADYGWLPALPALSRLRGLGVPVVLASSKTAAEIVTIRADLRLTHVPAIVENGAGLLEAGAGVATDAESGDYPRLRALIATLDPRLRNHFFGFGDWDVDEVALQTGLPPERAALAKARQFSEPGLFTGTRDARDAFVAALAAAGVTARRGGRFLTLSFGATKADHMDALLSRYTVVGGPRPLAVALGDAPNDVDMLNQADYGVIIPNPNGAELPILAGEHSARIRRSENPGPAGWNTAMLALTSELTGATGS
ncbi:HAD hydrolase family protein [Pseudooceanicola sp.]|uniref:HAD-IIB family hydrolase n=1 Tax=Pseudooceanicola sp. TaxID=1914328 RepID=UPI0026053376|nr:HAD hydrolase family protein [Pseudooceanicola sp.]MDF1853871.1 HAD hydrolase family protein [Pseudooceanicola sp.]